MPTIMAISQDGQIHKECQRQIPRNKYNECSCAIWNKSNIYYFVMNKDYFFKCLVPTKRSYHKDYSCEIWKIWHSVLIS